MTQEDAISIPQERAKKAKQDPASSFEEPVDVREACVKEKVYGQRRAAD